MIIFLAVINKTMHIFFKIVFFLTIIGSCQSSSGGRMPTTIHQEPDSEIYSFLKEGSYKVEYYPSKEITTIHKKLLQKLSKLVETNPRIERYFSQIEQGEKPKYNPNIGISEQENNRLIDIFTYRTPEKHNGTLTISKQGGYFTFKGDGRLSLLDSMTVGINNKFASFKKYNMSHIKDSIDLSNEEIPKGETLETFEFYNGPDGILGLSGLDGAYELLIGKLKPSGKTYLSFFAKQPDILEHPFPEYITVIFDK